METETKEIRLRDQHGMALLDTTPDELQAIVQAAYDQHGMLAEPSLERELARTAESWQCPCGAVNCSDAAVRA